MERIKTHRIKHCKHCDWKWHYCVAINKCPICKGELSEGSGRDKKSPESEES